MVPPPSDRGDVSPATKVTVTPNPQVMFRRLGDRMVLIHLQTNDIFDLNETSARFWELLASTRDLEQARAQLAAEFEVDPARLRDETEATLAVFARNDLITGV